MAQQFTKDPDATLDYSIDWATWLGADTISDSDWIADDGITVEVDPAPSNTTTTATVWLSGGTVGVVYRATNRIVTAGGRTNDRTIKIRVVQT